MLRKTREGTTGDGDDQGLLRKVRGGTARGKNHRGMLREAERRGFAALAVALVASAALGGVPDESSLSKKSPGSPGSPVSSQLGDSAPGNVGSVESLELTSLTRDRAAAWARTRLPVVAEGVRQTFEGEVAIANVPLPVRQPVVVEVRKRPGRSDAVFFLDLDLEKTPKSLLKVANAHAMDLTLKGTLKGEKGSRAPVCAVGVLRYGSNDIRSQSASVTAFARFSGARFTGMSLSETSGEATAVLYNPFGFPLDVKDITYTLWVGERKLGTGEKSALRIHARRESEIALPLTAGNAELFAVASQTLAAGGRVEGRLVASVTIRIGDADMKIPVDLPGAIEVAR
jgi:LEA14-like dessication related protein